MFTIDNMKEYSKKKILYVKYYFLCDCLLLRDIFFSFCREKFQLHLFVNLSEIIRPYKKQTITNAPSRQIIWLNLSFNMKYNLNFLNIRI